MIVVMMMMMIIENENKERIVMKQFDDNFGDAEDGTNDGVHSKDSRQDHRDSYDRCARYTQPNTNSYLLGGSPFCF